MNYYPLITPEIYTSDKHNDPCSYIPMNPSVSIIGDQIIILVRCVNYRKFSDKSFNMFNEKSNSIYFIARTKSLSNLEYKKLNVDYGKYKTFDSYWLGPEDIRFIDSSRVLVTIPELNSTGLPCIFFATLIDDNLKVINKLPDFSSPQKNWMPFNFQGDAIYSICPLKTINIYDNKIMMISNDEKMKDLNGYHGSSNGIDFNYQGFNGKLFLIHRNISIENGINETVNRWFFRTSENVKYSNPFKFFRYSYIEFTCSLCQFLEDTFLVSLGVNDSSAFLVEISRELIVKMLTV